MLKQSEKLKKSYFFAILGPQMNFLKKIVFFFQFLDLKIIFHHAKSYKKLMSGLWENCKAANRQVDA